MISLTIGNRGLKLAVVTFGLVAFASCMRVEDRKKNPSDAGSTPAQEDPTDTTSPAVESENSSKVFRPQLGDAQLALRESDKPHVYNMTIKWNSKIKQVSIENLGSRIYETSMANDYQSILADGTPYDLQVFAHDTGEKILIGQSTGVSPLDYVFTKSETLIKDTEIKAHRVYMLPGVKLQTRGHNLLITAAQFLVQSDDNEIFTFTDGQTADPLTNGKHGGHIMIRAQQATGRLPITMRGENGGVGRDGEPYSTRAHDGANGSSGAQEESHCSSELPACPMRCTRTPGNGTNGAPGEKGRPGLAGGRGGDSGKLVVEIVEPSEFELVPMQVNGTPGRSGKGGPGQEGGQLGHAGDRPNSCPHAAHGQPGPNGPVGDTPPEASSGNIEPMCISIGLGEGKCTE